MGQDLTLVFVPAAVADRTIGDALVSCATELEPANLAILATDPAADPLRLSQFFPEFSCFSVWADRELNASHVAGALSRVVAKRVLAVTMSDHACVGAFEVYSGGDLIDEKWVGVDDDDERDYTACGWEGFRAAYGIALPVTDDERLFLVETLAIPSRGICLASTSPHVRSGDTLTPDQIRQIQEDDVPGATYECCLSSGAELAHAAERAQRDPSVNP